MFSELELEVGVNKKVNERTIIENRYEGPHEFARWQQQVQGY